MVNGSGTLGAPTCVAFWEQEWRRMPAAGVGRFKRGCCGGTCSIVAPQQSERFCARRLESSRPW